MRSVVWRVAGGVRNLILPLTSHMGRLVRSRAIIVVAATLTIAGCAPYYYEPGDGRLRCGRRCRKIAAPCESADTDTQPGSADAAA